MASVFDIGTIGVDENDEIVIEFTEEFMELTVEERVESINNLIDYAVGIVDAASDEDDFEVDEDEEDAETESDDDDDDAFDPLQLS
jgi:hypothetical protein